MEALTIDVSEWLALNREANASLPVTFRVTTGSMRPLIRPETDAVTVRPVTRPLRKGDIVMFERFGGAKKVSYCLHRVRKLSGDTVTTKGDSCVSPDAPVPRSAVIGIAVSVVRNGKTIRLDTATGRNALLMTRLAASIKRRAAALRRYVSVHIFLRR